MISFSQILFSVTYWFYFLSLKKKKKHTQNRKRREENEISKKVRASKFRQKAGIIIL